MVGKIINEFGHVGDHVQKVRWCGGWLLCMEGAMWWGMQMLRCICVSVLVVEVGAVAVVSDIIHSGCGTG